MTPPDRNTFAARLRYLRTRHGLNQTQVGKAAGVSQASISEWELGKATAAVPELTALCNLFSVCADFLIGRTDYEQGLAPDSWLVDLDALEQRTPGEGWAAKVPRRHRIVDYNELVQLQDELARQGKRKRGRGGSDAGS